MNSCAKDKLVKVVNFEGDEYLFYPTLKWTWPSCAAPSPMRTAAAVKLYKKAHISNLILPFSRFPHIEAR